MQDGCYLVDPEMWGVEVEHKNNTSYASYMWPVVSRGPQQEYARRFTTCTSVCKLADISVLYVHNRFAELMFTDEIPTYDASDTMKAVRELCINVLTRVQC
jgi:hypothetical protein